MALVVADRVSDLSTTTGTGTVTLAGTPPTGFRSFASVCTNGDTTYYAIAHQTANEWEVGLGTYTGGTLSRDSIYASSNSGSAVNFSSGTKDVYIVAPAEQMVLQSRNLSDLQSASTARTNLGLGSASTLASSAVLQTANNLSEVTASTARTNLGLGSAATQSTATFLQTANNLSDVTAATARTNLGLGSAATLASTAVAQTANNLSDLASAATSRSNLLPSYATNATKVLAVNAGATDVEWVTGGGGNTFSTVAVSGQSDVVADSSSDTLTLAAGAAIALTTNATTDTVTVALASSPTLSGHPTIEGVTSTGATGTGKLVFDGSPTLTTPTLDTPTVSGSTVLKLGTSTNITTPAVQFSDDANTGIGHPAADTMVLTTAGTEVMRLNANGTIGISNTASNNTALVTIKTVGLHYYTSGAGGPDGLKLIPSTGGAGVAVQNTNAAGFSGIEYLDSTGALQVFTGYNNAGAEFRFNNIATNGYIVFKIASNDKLKIFNNGDVLALGGGLGYGTGTGGSVTQATSRTTGVTLNKTNGAITLVSAAGSTSWQSFTVTNSTVAATDTIHVVQKSGTDLHQIFVTNVAAGSFQITFATTGGTTTEQPVFTFAVFKAVTA